MLVAFAVVFVAGAFVCASWTPMSCQVNAGWIERAPVSEGVHARLLSVQGSACARPREAMFRGGGK